jgi:hypothetical protein
MNKNVSYSAVVLDEKSRNRLIKVFWNIIPSNFEVIAHHMTIKMGALDNDSQEKRDLLDGKTIQLTANDYSIDDKVMAVGVDGYPTHNNKAHITLAVNRQNGGKPFMSNKLTDWKPLGFQIKLTGKVTEV